MSPKTPGWYHSRLALVGPFHACAPVSWGMRATSDTTDYEGL
jgi:hypothetical protein